MKYEPFCTLPLAGKQGTKRGVSRPHPFRYHVFCDVYITGFQPDDELRLNLSANIIRAGLSFMQLLACLVFAVNFYLELKRR